MVRIGWPRRLVFFSCGGLGAQHTCIPDLFTPRHLLIHRRGEQSSCRYPCVIVRREVGELGVLRAVLFRILAGFGTVLGGGFGFFRALRDIPLKSSGSLSLPLVGVRGGMSLPWHVVFRRAKKEKVLYLYVTCAFFQHPREVHAIVGPCMPVKLSCFLRFFRTSTE